MAFMFECLQVHHEAVDFANRILSLTDSFPRGYYFLVDRLNRAALSIATNLAEGNGRLTKSDQNNFFIVARDSVQESVPLLKIPSRRGYISSTDHHAIKNTHEEILRMTAGLITGLENRQS